MIRGMGVAQSARRNFVIPGSITLDTDSEVNQSNLHIRDKLMNNNTTRNIRNRTIDPNLHDGNYRSNLSGSVSKVGAKKLSLQHANLLMSSDKKTMGSSKPTLLVENSEA